MLLIIETFVDYCGPVPYYGAILLEQISVPEDTDYGKRKKTDTWNDSNPAFYSFFGPIRNGR
jgi:hypothetical protein